MILTPRLTIFRHPRAAPGGPRGLGNRGGSRNATTSYPGPRNFIPPRGPPGELDNRMPAERISHGRREAMKRRWPIWLSSQFAFSFLPVPFRAGGESAAHLTNQNR